MPTQASKIHSAEELMDALTVARDRARVQAHLFSLDARKRWQGIEAKLLELKAKLEQSGEKIAETAAANVREVTHAAGELLRELDGTLELATPVGKLMNAAPSTCAPGDSLEQAAQVMWERDCGVVPVLAADGSLVGIVTDRDVCMAAYTRGQPLGALTVESTMSQLVHACSPDDSMGHALRLMAAHRVRRLPVVEDGRFVGLVTLADVARDIRKQPGNRVPACVALADTLAVVCEQRPTTVERAHAAE